MSILPNLFHQFQNFNQHEKIDHIPRFCFYHGLVNAQTTDWSFDRMHTNVGFSISHMGISMVEGEFDEFSGGVTTTKEDFSDAQVDLPSRQPA
ncbi:MAG: YceI family protein [Saprospiraceae bacterium]|nr:YceI family protein [Saprospiraceae bacterium]